MGINRSEERNAERCWRAKKIVQKEKKKAKGPRRASASIPGSFSRGKEDVKDRIC